MCFWRSSVFVAGMFVLHYACVSSSYKDAYNNLSTPRVVESAWKVTASVFWICHHDAMENLPLNDVNLKAFGIVP
ncbi:hypothetical protein Ancab_016487, partial [Ancistrocladus abbreviatus]